MFTFYIITAKKEDIKVIPLTPGVLFKDCAEKFEQENNDVTIINAITYVENCNVLPYFPVKAKSMKEAERLAVNTYPGRSVIQIFKVEEMNQDAFEKITEEVDFEASLRVAAV